MKFSRLGLLGLALAAFAAPAMSQAVGSSMPAVVEVDGMAGSKATSYDDFLGRTVLIEFFAYW